MKTLINIFNYRGFGINIFQNDYTKFYHATSKIACSFNKFNSKLGNTCFGFESQDEAVNDLKHRIDYFLENLPTTYEGLAEKITDTLIWDGYEKYHADPEIIKILFENFKLVN